MEVTIKKEINNIWDLYYLTWSGATVVINKVIDLDRGEELMEWLEERFAGEELTDVEINDYLWFELEEEDQWSNLWEDEEDD